MPLPSGVAARELMEFGRPHIGSFRCSEAISAFEPGESEVDVATFTRASRTIAGRTAADPK
jgi:hypothetical protein